MDYKPVEIDEKQESDEFKVKLPFIGTVDQ